MRWFEITESTAEDVANKAERRTKARQRLADAERKKSDATQCYQDQLEVANDAQKRAAEILRDSEE
jgi:hypothetical protein